MLKDIEINSSIAPPTAHKLRLPVAVRPAKPLVDTRKEGRMSEDERRFAEVVQAAWISVNGFETLMKNESAVHRFAFTHDPAIASQVAVVRTWLRRFQRRTTINRTMSTNGIRVRCEVETRTEISHGALIAGCLLEDVQVKRCGLGSREGWTSLSFKLADPTQT